MGRKKGKAQEELIAGFPLLIYQKFLCHQVEVLEYGDDDWFDFDISARLSFGHKKPIEPAVQEMLARGWIEPVASKSQTQRYRLTEAGKDFAAESRHLFKWPAWRSRIRPASRYHGRIGCLTHLYAELGRLRTGDCAFRGRRPLVPAHGDHLFQAMATSVARGA